MNVELRPATGVDAEEIAAIYAPHVRDSATSFETVPPTGDEIGRRIAVTTQRYPWLVCVAESRVLGYAYASEHRSRAAYRWSVDTSVYVHDQAQGRGVGRGLYQALFACLRLQAYANAYAGITLPNPASVALHTAMGFTPVGVYQRVGHKLGAWHDVGWWHLALVPADGDPAEPRSFPEVVNSAPFAVSLREGAALVRR